MSFGSDSGKPEPLAAHFPVGLAKQERGPLVPDEPTNRAVFHQVIQVLVAM